jgi:serine protease AprX
MDAQLEARAARGSSLNKSRVIVTFADGTDAPVSLQKYSKFGRLAGINGHVLDIPDSELNNLADLPQTVHVHADADVHGMDFRTAVTSGSFFVNHDMGFTGTGVAVAVLDSGIASTHQDLPTTSVVCFKDFVNGRLDRYDDSGHGTHVAGIINGNGLDSGGQWQGTAPAAKLVVLKVLDSQGNGRVSNVIAALDWLATYGPSYGVRVVNLSFGAKPDETPELDPLALAAKALVDRGVVVVAAAGNNGRSGGKKVWGGIPSPADAPWVITVGASSSMGTLTRRDDTMASFSSRGPAVGHIAKPDLVASGVGIVSTISGEGSLIPTESQFLVSIPCPLRAGCPTPSSPPYMSLSGTSMAAPVVSGTIALMLQANPNLTPNLVKAILQYTAEFRGGYSPLEQGAGFLNSLGAVRLARYYATATALTHPPVSATWGKAIVWGNHRLTGGLMKPSANAWTVGTQWGALQAPSGYRVVWGTSDSDDNIIWGTSDSEDNIVWGTDFSDDNIVWGTECGGADCGDNIIWGTSFDIDNIIWGTDFDLDNIIWGTSDADDNIVWGTSDDDNIVWGTSDDDNIVWGTSLVDNIVWGTSITDNSAWGTRLNADNLMWGTNYYSNITWGTGNVGWIGVLPSLPTYGWFLNATNDEWWVASEFGDGFTVRR